MKIIDLREAIDHEGTFAHGVLVVVPTDRASIIDFEAYHSDYTDSNNNLQYRSVKVLTVYPPDSKDGDYVFIIRVRRRLNSKIHAAVKGRENHKRIYNELMNIYRNWEKNQGFPEGSVNIKSLEPLTED